jgi:tetratricopeptide (TPR) repeat protein
MKIGLHMIVAGEVAPVISCLESQRGLMDCGVILVDSKENSNSLYDAVVAYFADVSDVVVRRHIWQNSFAQARNEALNALLLEFPSVDYVYWVDGDDVWSKDVDKETLRKRLLEESPIAVNLIYQYSANTRLYRNRFWKVDSGSVPYYWRGTAHEVEWTDALSWPTVVNWDDFVLVHTKENLQVDSKTKHNRNIELLKNGTESDPTFARNYYYLSQEQFDNKLYEEAIQSFYSYAKYHENNIAEYYQAYIIKIKSALALLHYNDAENAATQAIDLYPNSPFAYTLMGLVFINQKKWENAVPYFLKAISVPGAPVIFDFEALRTVVPLRWLSVCYEKMGDITSAQYYHYLANKCNVDDGLRIKNSVWLSCNKYLRELESEHFNKTGYNDIDTQQYMLIDNFNSDTTKLHIIGAMDYNSAMRIVRILNEGTSNETAVIFKGVPDYKTTVTVEEKLELQTKDYKDLFRSEQFSLFENFYNHWVDFAVKRSRKELLSVVELGTDIGLSARMIHDRIKKHRGNDYYDITLIDTNLTKEAWAIVDDENVFFIHMRAEDAVKYFEDESIDILHMDLAPHSYEQAADIFRKYESKLTKEGIMLWHDVGISKRFSFGGRKFLDELRYPWCISYCSEDTKMIDEAPAVIFRSNA